MTPPTVEEVRLYWLAALLRGDADEFYDHFKANGWKVGRVPMQDWEAAARNWSRNEVKWGKAEIGVRVTGLIDTADSDREAEAQRLAAVEIAEIERMRAERKP